MAELKKVCKSSLNLKIITFFHENPATVDTARGIAAWLNCDHKLVEEALKYLVTQEILVVHQTGSTTAYAYTQDKEVINQIEKLLQDRERECADV